MKNLDQYKRNFEQNYTRLTYKLLNEKLFVAFGLELTSTGIKFCDNSDFPLVGQTFAFYNPIEDAISVNVEDPFFTSELNEAKRMAKLTFILFHEAYHKTLMHTERCGAKDHQLWNIAADYEVHNMLYLYCDVCAADASNTLKTYFETIKEMIVHWDDKNYKPVAENGEIKGLFGMDMLEHTAEEIYQMIINSKKTSSQTISMGGSGSNSKDSEEGSSMPDVTATVSEYELPNGSTVKTVTIDWPEENQLPADMQKTEAAKQADKDNRELRKQLMEQNLRQTAEMHKGCLSSSCERFLKKLFKIKVDWEKILRSSLQTILTKSDYFTWARPRTSMFAMDMYLPDIVEDNQGYGTLIVVRDESGSMTDEAVAKCGAIIADAKEHYKKIIVLKHDTEIQYKGEFEELTEDVMKMLCTRATCGGTSHKQVFEFLSQYHKEHRFEDDAISCVIMMTDCCSDIQEYQNMLSNDVPLIYMVPECGMSYTAGVRGKIIPIEM